MVDVRTHAAAVFWLWMRHVPASLLGLALVGLVACAPATPQQPTLVPTTVPSTRVTADQVAQSMQDDQFFTDFGDATLLVQGTVAAIEQQGSHTLLRLATNLTFDVVCDTGAEPTGVQVGQVITVKLANPRRDASRDIRSVLLHNCSLV